MLHHGPVRVPADAQPGKAVIRVQLKDDSQFRSLPTDIAVTLVK